MTDDPLATLLTAARPEIDRTRTESLSLEVARSVAQTRRRAPRRRLTVGLTALALAIPSTAAAYEWTTHTGVFGDPSVSTEVDATEWLDLCAPDFLGTARDLAPENLALPPGTTPETALQDMFGEPDPACPEPGARRQAGGVRLAYHSWAACAWVHTWLGDPSQREVAATEIARFADSRILASHDGGGTVELMQSVADAARTGDRAVLEREADVNCAGVGTTR